MKPFQYLTSCVNSTANDINKMVDNAIDITYDTFAKYVDVREVSTQFGYELNKSRGLTLKEDWAVSFHKSTYCKHPCYYMRHSSIEYIYVKGI